MFDERTQELISGYLDDALSSEELATVERQLAESAEARQFLDQLRRQQSALRAIPRRKAAVNLSSRVVAEIERRQAERSTSSPLESAQHPVQRPGSGRSGSGRLGVGRWVLASAGGVAAALLVWAVVQNRPEVGTSGSGVAVVPVPSTQSVPPEIQPRVQPRVPSNPLPEITLAHVDRFRQIVSMCMVLDVTVTPAGQEVKVIDQCLAAAGIPRVPPVPVDDRLEKLIRDSSIVAKKPIGPVEGGAGATDRVEMFLIRGTNRHVDRFYREFQTLDERSNRLGTMTMNVVFANQELQLFMQLNVAQGVKLADLETKSAILKEPAAVPLQFADELRSLVMERSIAEGVTLVGRRSARVLAQATPAVRAVAKPQVAANAVEQGTGWDEPSQALVILRNQLP